MTVGSYCSILCKLCKALIFSSCLSQTCCKSCIKIGLELVGRSHIANVVATEVVCIAEKVVHTIETKLNSLLSIAGLFENNSELLWIVVTIRIDIVEIVCKVGMYHVSTYRVGCIGKLGIIVHTTVHGTVTIC